MSIEAVVYSPTAMNFFMVDDDPDILALRRGVLRDAGHEVAATRPPARRR